MFILTGGEREDGEQAPKDELVPMVTTTAPSRGPSEDASVVKEPKTEQDGGEEGQILLVVL